MLSEDEGPLGACDALSAFAGGKKNMKTKRLVVNALCVAMYVVLSSYVSLSLGGIKITIDALPILLAAILFGPVDGLIVGLLGNLLGQLLGPYGLSVTTPLWMLPAGLRGLLVGLAARKKSFSLKYKPLGLLLVVTALIVTAVNTGVMWVDCLVFQYSFATYSPYIVARVIAGVGMAVVFTFVLPPLVKALGWKEREN